MFFILYLKIFLEMKERGVVSAELNLRPEDDVRLNFWRQALLEQGAVRSEPWPHSGFEMYRLP